MSESQRPNETPKPCRIVIADDSEPVRAGVKDMLANHPQDFTVIGEADNGEDAVKLIYNLEPDLAMLDLRMPRMDGIDAVRNINAHKPEIPILILTSHANPNFLYEAVLAGAAGYILKEASSQELVDKIRRVIDGEPVLDAEVVLEYMRTAHQDRESVIVTTIPENRGELQILEELSPREKQVLSLVACGYSNEKIAQLMFISPHTVKNHIRSILPKMKASDRTQAAVKAVKLGILDQVEGDSEPC